MAKDKTDKEKKSRQKRNINLTEEQRFEINELRNKMADIRETGSFKKFYRDIRTETVKINLLADKSDSEKKYLLIELCEKVVEDINDSINT